MSSQQETKPSNQSDIEQEPTINFGSGDNMMKVRNVVIKVKGGPVYDVKANAISNGYTNVRVHKDCTEVYMVATGSKDEEEKPNGEIFIPLVNIWRIAVDWFPGTKRQG